MNVLYANERPGVYPQSYYVATADLLPAFAPLKGERRADVCVVGGGYSGLSAALHLRRRGYAVTLLDAHRLGWGASGRNGGQLGSGQNADPKQLVERFGLEDARRLWRIAEDAKRL
ncbi:MAG: FAD-binding oxidoreductase, partial [Pseudomonadota bacterium]